MTIQKTAHGTPERQKQRVSDCALSARRNAKKLFPLRVHTGDLERLKSVICDALRLYFYKYQEEIQPWVYFAVHAVWFAVRQLDSRTRFDMLLAAAADCLSAAAATEWEMRTLPDSFASAAVSLGLPEAQVQELQQKRLRGPANPFQEEALLRDILEGVIVPNIALRDKDLELLEDSPMEFVRRDVEGFPACPHLPRRACVSDLIKGMCRLQQQQLQQLLLQLVQQLAGQADAAGGGATERGARLVDSAVFVMAAVASRALHSGAAAAAASPTELAAFFTTHVARELQQQQQQERKCLAVAAALKFLATFRAQLPISLLCESLPLVSALLLSPHEALRAYAAFCMHRLLACRNSQGQRLIDPSSCQPILLKSLSFLRQSLSDVKARENEFAVKALARLLLCLGAAAASESLPLLQLLLQQIKAEASQPGNPVYCHYLFECLAVICRLASDQTRTNAASAEAGASCLQQQHLVEEHVVPVLSVLIQQSQHEFTPYCFQILGVLLEGASRTGTIGSSRLYVDLLEHLLQPHVWVASQGNVPALVRLVSVFLRQLQQQGYHQPQQQQQQQQIQVLLHGRVAQLLERMQFCIYHRKLAAAGFDLLNAIFRFLPFEAYKQLLPTLLTVLLKRAHQLQQQTFNAHLSFSLLLFQCRSPDITALPCGLEQLQQGLLQQVVCAIALPSVQHSLESGCSLSKKKVFMVGLARLAAAAAAAAAEPQLLHKMLQTMETLLSGYDFGSDLLPFVAAAAATERADRRAAAGTDFDPDDDVSWSPATTAAGTAALSGVSAWRYGGFARSAARVAASLAAYDPAEQAARATSQGYVSREQLGVKSTTAGEKGGGKEEGEHAACSMHAVRRKEDGTDYAAAQVRRGQRQSMLLAFPPLGPKESEAIRYRLTIGERGSF
ncbi:exportin-2 [Cyclospora cayetanensis]|uniref:Exportin-2 n=1 Tax=Cyclospora cayetanensis TaxID=88456 RepID=A0A6P6S1Q9_9EIME|nr:exportin-2 [Cyclospora cayetanensis]